MFPQVGGGRPTRGALRDGWDLARMPATGGELLALAAPEPALREEARHHGGERPPRRRGVPTVPFVTGSVVLGWLGRVHLLGR